MNTRLLLVVFLLFAVSKQEVLSQLGFSHEVGIYYWSRGILFRLRTTL